MKLRKFSLLIVLTIILVLPGIAYAQEYYFQNPVKSVDVYWNEDGTSSLFYVLDFVNDPAGHSIEYVDLSLPNDSFNTSNIQAWVDDQPISFISKDEYQGDGTGVALGLGSFSIPPGQSGRVTASVAGIREVLYPDDDDSNYASAVFAPAYFISSVVFGSSNISVTFHLPPGVQPDEPRWHTAPAGFNDPPETWLDDQGRVVYHWQNTNAQPDKQYNFGASFPKQYIPEDTIVTSSAFSRWLSNININFEALLPFGCIGIFILFGILGSVSNRSRRMQYMPPKIKLEGNGIRRGLTAVEAAILLEQPLDKVMTMILFSVVKKNAARVAKRDPLTLEFAKPQPEGLHEYEKDFLEAFHQKGSKRKQELQTLTVNLIKATTNKMRGFSSNETKDYYRSIIEKAWQQVEAAETPEIRSEKYDDVMEWTMLDKNYDDRTRDVFRSGPVFIPSWWIRYDPGYRSSPGRHVASSPTQAPSPSSGGSLSLPTLPGSNFAAGVVNGVQSFSAGVIGNLTDFTSNVTQKTNPIPVSRSSGSSSRSSGGSCACACACAGCACACAGGGR